MLHDSSKNKKLILAIIVVAFCACIYFLRLVFSGQITLPQFFSLGFITIHYYGIIMATAVAGAFYLAIKRADQFGISSKQAEDMIFWVVVGGFLGARLYHVLSSAGFYWQNPADILKVWQGGLSIYGAVIGGFVTILIYRKLSTIHYPLLTILDWLALPLLFGQIIGRFGNLFNYEAFGYPTNLPWKMFVPQVFRPEQYQNFNFFHPFFLYEALGNAIIFFLLLKVIKTKKPGVLFFSYLLLYNVLRFALEFFRVDSTFIGGFRLNSLTSLVLAILAFSAILYIKKNAKIS